MKNNQLKINYRNRLAVYGELMRIEKPIGTLLLLWPTWWALWIAGQGRPLWWIVVLFTLGTFFMRSAGCVINDFADRHFDGAVARTKNRPFAQHKVSSEEAIILTIFLCLLAALCVIPMNYLTWIMAIPALFLAITYPFTKRFFAVPQFYLGLAFSFGIPMSFAALTHDVPPIVWLIFAANVFWTLAYDTIYAMADKPDDIKLGLKSSALTFGRHDIHAVLFFHAVFTLLMIVLGCLIKATWPYWLVVIIVIYLQHQQYKTIRHRNREQCTQTFLQNNYIGLLYFIGLALHYLWQSWI